MWFSQKSARQAPAGADVPEKNEIKIQYDSQFMENTEDCLIKYIIINQIKYD